MNVTKQISISSTTYTCTDNAKEDTIPSCQYSSTPTDNFNLCYTPTDENLTLCNVISNIEIAQVHQITSTVNTAKNKIFVYPKEENKSNEVKVTSKTFSLPMTNTNKCLSANEEETETLLLNGFKKDTFISKTLQGTIFTAKVVNSENENEYVAIKTANIKLYQQGIAINGNGKRFNVKENIVKEKKIMKLFMDNNPPNTCIKYHKFFMDSNQFYLVIEKGGECLFEFTVKCHKLIKENKLSLKEWIKSAQFIFNKMAKFIHWLHNKMHCSHLDISLENVVICRDTVFDEKSGEIKNLDIRFIDFGLTELFDKHKNPQFNCTKFVGKNGYKSPQIFERKSFHANKADIWALGVSLFMLIIGAPPYQSPNVFDAAFRLIKNDKIKDLLRNWNRLQYVVPDMLDLLSRMLCYNESNRIDIDGICNHVWLKDIH